MFAHRLAPQLPAIGLLLALLAPAGGRADPGQRRVNGMDLFASESNLSRSLLVTPSGHHVLFGTAQGDRFSRLADWKAHAFDELVGDDDPEASGRFWFWWQSSDFAQIAFSGDGGKLVSPATVNGKLWIGLGDMDTLAPAEALVQVPKDFWEVQALAWSPDRKGVYLKLGYRLQRPRARPEDDNPVTENFNVKLRVSQRYEPKPEPVEWVPAAYPGAVAQFQRDFVVYYDFAEKTLRRVFTGNDIRSIVFSPDGSRVLVSQNKLGIKDGVRRVLVDVYLIPVPSAADMPEIDLVKAKEAERNAGWFDCHMQRIDPVLADLAGFSGDSSVFYRPTWSPDGSRFAFLGQIDRDLMDVWCYDIAGKHLVNLTAGADVGEALAKSPWRIPPETNAGSPEFSAWVGPSWTADGRTVAVTTTRGQLWLVPTDGKTPPADHTPASGPGIVRVVEAAGRTGALVAQGSRFLVHTSDPEKLADGLAWFDPSVDRLQPIHSGAGLIHVAMVSASENRLCFNETDPAATAQLYALPFTGAETPQRLTDFESDLNDCAWPQKRLVPFVTAGKREGYARLLLPPGADETRPCPVLIMSSPESSSLWTWRYWGRDIIGPAADAPEQWTDHGYAVLIFDVPANPWKSAFVDPLQLAAEACDAATDAAVATGLIDPARMALYGVGHEGYLVQGLITRLDRYQAAVAVGSAGDLTALALLGDPNLVSSRYRMDTDFIDNPRRYLDSSPIAYFKKVRTPLLLIDGEVNMGSGGNPFADESFTALAPTGTPVVRAIYNKPAGDDLMRRIFVWLDEHLNGAPAVSGLATLPEPRLETAATRSGTAQ